MDEYSARVRHGTRSRRLHWLRDPQRHEHVQAEHEGSTPTAFGFYRCVVSFSDSIEVSLLYDEHDQFQDVLTYAKVNCVSFLNFASGWLVGLGGEQYEQDSLLYGHCPLSHNDVT